MRTVTLLAASLLILPALMNAVPASPTSLDAAAPASNDAVLALPAPEAGGGLPLDLPFVVDEAGDTIEGDLSVTGTLTVNGQVTLTAPLAMPGGHGIVFDGGRLAAQDRLAFDGVAVCLADSAVPGCSARDGSITLAQLAFDPATQEEVDAALAAHRASGDHDARHPTRAELAEAGTVNDAANPMHWSRLKGVPAGFADGVDDDTDTTYTAGTGLVMEGTEFRVDATAVQQRVTGACAAGSSIRAIAQDGAVTCEADDDTDTTYTAGEALALSGTTFSVADGGVAAHKLAFDPATQAELDAHEAEADERYARAGGSATFEQVSLTATPTDGSHAATKAYVDGSLPTATFRRASASAVPVPYNQWVTVVTLTAAPGKELVDLSGGVRGGSHGIYRVSVTYTDGTADTGPQVGSSFSGQMWLAGLTYGSKSSGNPNWAFDPFPGLHGQGIREVRIQAMGGGTGGTIPMDGYLYAREL